MLSPDRAAELSDRVYQVRCAAEDVATAVREGADPLNCMNCVTR